MKTVFGFLDLPLPIREEIYSLCGLLRECPIDITPNEPLPSSTESSRSQEDSWDNPIDRQTLLAGPILEFRCPKIPTDLLLVSKKFSKDVFKTLYGKNQFVLRAEKASDFIFLLSMKVSSLAAMTSLLVRLNCWPCRYGHEGDISLIADGTPCFICSSPISEYGSVLDHTSTEGKEMTNQWNTACKHLAAAVVPRQLSLTFIADVANVETGRQVMASLRTLPKLRECRIRLGRQNNTDLQSLAQSTAVEMTDTFIPAQGFSFSRLPKELRLQILNYSHLGVPGSYDPSAEKICITNSKLNRYYRLDGNSARCCYKCTDTFADCCCPWNHAAYSATCACRILPLDLFLVSHQMREDACQVFFSNAHFIFCDEPSNAIKFLKSLPSDALPLIQKVELIVQDPETNSWRSGNYSADYRKLAVFMNDNLKTERLSVEINSWWMFNVCMWAEEEEENRYYYDIVSEIAEAMVSLKGPKTFKFKLGWFFALGPIFEKRILGERFVAGPEETFERKGQSFRRGYPVPSWHKSTS